MTATEFANKLGFSDIDQFVIAKMYKGVSKSEHEWSEELAGKFNFTNPQVLKTTTPPQFLLNKSGVQSNEEVKEEKLPKKKTNNQTKNK